MHLVPAVTERTKAILVGVTLAALLTVAMALSGFETARATTHCVHHHPNHHRTGSSGYTEHHFHQTHDWGNNNGSIWLVSDNEHFCF